MTRIDARELAVRLVFAASENTPDPAEELLWLYFNDDTGYYQTLSEEDELYASELDDSAREYVSRVVLGVADHMSELDSYIEKHAKNWGFHRISRTALAVMRVCMFEVLYMRTEVPERAAINAAIDISKRYDTDETVKFVNGVLGAFSRSELPEV